MDKKRVLVIDDSAFMRKVISDIINDDSSLEVIGTARNGEDGLKKVEKLNPDVVTLDIEMPIMDGLTALKRIMDDYPTPVIMLSSLTYEGAESTITALQYGAIDFINKTSGSISLDLAQKSAEICEKVKDAAHAKLHKSMALLPEATPNELTINRNQPSKKFQHEQTLVVVGVSTGGPKALQELLSRIPESFSCPILIVQHMPAKFTRSLAERLDRLSEISVKEVQHGELLKRGHAYIAPGDNHFEVKSIGRSLAAIIEQTPAVNGHRPSVNKLFKSVAGVSHMNKVAVVLTGMGSDGTEGAKHLKEQDSSTYLIAESKETAVIYGMPKSIVEQANPNLIKPINEMADAIVETVKQ
ncbi:protein-glutamate methylesterase/protein-glutamine glutaminase [Alkalibacillus sp. S2W]|uniref:protein-glutamate methylesterase/protein-glutamine glutaminase n=1 Tax=Alkalibacillus sp. S2W TaxID=3386553 RepID=UPI00398CDFE0